MRTLVIFTSGSTEAKKKEKLGLISGYSVPAVFRTFYFNYPGEGGGGYSTNFYTGRLRLEVQPLTLLNEKGTPSVYLPLTNGISFTYFV